MAMKTKFRVSIGKPIGILLAVVVMAAVVWYFRMNVFRQPHAGTTTLVSLDPSGKPSNFNCILEGLSADGNKLTMFLGYKGKEISQDASYVRDLQQQKTTLVFPHKTLGHFGFAYFGTTLVGMEKDGIYLQSLPTETSKLMLPLKKQPGMPIIGKVSLSKDQQYLAFVCADASLATAKNNTKDSGQYNNVYFIDGKKKQIEFVSIASDGSRANQGSETPAISDDGRYVAFQSAASNLLSGSKVFSTNVYLRDRVTKTTTCISVDTNGKPVGGYEPTMSTDGRYIAFTSQSSGLVTGGALGDWQVYLYDRQTKTVRLVSHSIYGHGGNSASGHPVISADGQYVAFCSTASDLVPFDINDATDVFRFNCQTGAVQCVSVTSAGLQGKQDSGDMKSVTGFPYTGIAISADGSRVAFESNAFNPQGDKDQAMVTTRIYLHDFHAQ
jgi:hypothetical protein